MPPNSQGNPFLHLETTSKQFDHANKDIDRQRFKKHNTRTHARKKKVEN